MDSKRLLKSKLRDSDNDLNNNVDHDNEDKFCDMKTLAKHNVEESKESVQIFGPSSIASSIGEAAKDQFVAALLRLQQDCDTTCLRIQELETKLDSSIENSKAVQSCSNDKQNPSKASNISKGKFLTSLTLIGWPVFVYLTLRALERRYITSKA